MVGLAVVARDLEAGVWADIGVSVELGMFVYAVVVDVTERLYLLPSVIGKLAAGEDMLTDQAPLP